MKSRFSHHYDILPAAQRKIWPALVRFKERFVLYGDTALALRIGHRQSVDFDLFSRENLEHRWIASNLPNIEKASLQGLEDSVKRTLTEAVERVLESDSLPELKIKSFSLK